MSPASVCSKTITWLVTLKGKKVIDNPVMISNKSNPATKYSNLLDQPVLIRCLRRLISKR